MSPLHRASSSPHWDHCAHLVPSRCASVGRWTGHQSRVLALPHQLSLPPGPQCNASVDLIGTCWPRSPAGQLVVRPCPAYFYGVRYNTTSKGARGGQPICREVGRDGDGLRLVGGGGNIIMIMAIYLTDTTTIYRRPALCSLLLIPTISLEDAIYNSIVFIVYCGLQGSERLGNLHKLTSW